MDSIISALGTLHMDECSVKRNTISLIYFTSKVNVTNSVIEDAQFHGWSGILWTTNSSFYNSNLIASRKFVSSRSKFVSSSLSISGGQTIINQSLLINSSLEYPFSVKSTVLNTSFYNTSISVARSRVVFTNSQIYPSQVSIAFIEVQHIKCDSLLN